MRVADLEFDGAPLPGYSDPVGDTPAALTASEVADYTDHTVTMTLTDLTFNAEDATLRVALGTSSEFNPEDDVYVCEYIVDIENGVASVPSMAISPEWNTFLLNGVPMYVRFELVVNNYILQPETGVVTVGNFEPTSALSQHIFDTAEFIHGIASVTATSTTLDADTYTLTNITATGVISQDDIELEEEEEDNNDIQPNMLNSPDTRTLNKSEVKSSEKNEQSDKTSLEKSLEKGSEKSGEIIEQGEQSDLTIDEPDDSEECEPYETPTDGGLCELIPAPYRVKAVKKRGRKSVTTVDMSSHFSGTGDGTDFSITFDYDPNIQKAMDITMYGTFTNGDIEIPVKWTIHKDEIMLVQAPLADSTAACFFGIPYPTGSASSVRNNTTVQFGQTGTPGTMITNPGLILNNAILAINKQGTSSYILYDAFKEVATYDVGFVSTLSCAETIGSTAGNTGLIFENLRYTSATASDGYSYPVYLTNKMTAALMAYLPNIIYYNNTGLTPIDANSAELSTRVIPYEGTVTMRWARASGTRASIALTPADEVINKMVIGIPSAQPTATLPAYLPGGPIDSTSATNLLNESAYIVDIVELSALSDSDTYIDTTGAYVQADCVTDIGMSVEYLYTADENHRILAHVTTTGNTDPAANGYQINYSGNKMISTAGTYTSNGGTVNAGTVGLFKFNTHSNVYKPIFTIPAGTP